MLKLNRLSPLISQNFLALAVQPSRNYAPRKKKVHPWTDLGMKRAMKQELHWHRAETIDRNPIVARMDHIRQLSVEETTQESEEDDILYKSIDIECRGHDPAVLQSYQTFALAAAKHLEIPVSKTWEEPTILWRTTVLKSVHIIRCIGCSTKLRLARKDSR